MLVAVQFSTTGQPPCPICLELGGCEHVKIIKQGREFYGVNKGASEKGFWYIFSENQEAAEKVAEMVRPLYKTRPCWGDLGWAKDGEWEDILYFPEGEYINIVKHPKYRIGKCLCGKEFPHKPNKGYAHACEFADAWAVVGTITTRTCKCGYPLEGVHTAIYHYDIRGKTKAKFIIV